MYSTVMKSMLVAMEFEVDSVLVWSLEYGICFWSCFCYWSLVWSSFAFEVWYGVLFGSGFRV